MDTLPSGNVELTEAKIRAFYNESANEHFVPTLHNSDMSDEFIVSAAQKPFVHCVLHFRRMETLHDGLRWFDLKRYGIEITHKRGTDPLRTLTWDDDRRVIQLPQKVLIAGMTANPREKQGDYVSPNTVNVTGSYDPDDSQLKVMLPLIGIGSQVSVVNNEEEE